MIDALAILAVIIAAGWLLTRPAARWHCQVAGLLAFVAGFVALAVLAVTA